MSTLIARVQSSVDSTAAEMAWFSLWLVGWPLMMAVVISRSGT